MTSAIRTNNRHNGFTLIEIVIVLSLAAMILGGAVGAMIYSSDDRALRVASVEVESLAKRARVSAILHQTPYALEFREGVVRLMPYAQAGQEEKKKSRTSLQGKALEPGSSNETREFRLDPGMEVSILRWNSDKWLTTQKDTFHIWRFDPDGLCEPISVRFNYADSWLQDAYHPLTASIEDTQSETR